MVYLCVFDPMCMPGFAPEKAPKSGVRRVVDARASSGSVLQMQRWWQDPMTYHAFETKAVLAGSVSTGVDDVYERGAGVFARGSASGLSAHEGGAQVLLLRGVVWEFIEEGKVQCAPLHVRFQVYAYGLFHAQSLPDMHRENKYTRLQYLLT